MTYLAVLLYPFVYKAKTARHRNNLWKAGADPGGGGGAGCAPPPLGPPLVNLSGILDIIIIHCVQMM
jgi:hypothetical protein